MTAPLVLIVDNEEGLLVLFGRLIERLDCDTITIDNGADAIAFLREETPDLLILDLAMPETSGFDVLQFVASERRLDSMRVMILTATGPGPAPKDVDRRIDRWVTKPVLPTIFLDHARQLLDVQA